MHQHITNLNTLLSICLILIHWRHRVLTVAHHPIFKLDILVISKGSNIVVYGIHE